MVRKKKGRVGSSFDAFLAEEGILKECEEQAVSQILADRNKAATEKEPRLGGNAGPHANEP
jgi:hypothetical protein